MPGDEYYSSELDIVNITQRAIIKARKEEALVMESNLGFGNFQIAQGPMRPTEDDQTCRRCSQKKVDPLI